MRWSKKLDGAGDSSASTSSSSGRGQQRTVVVQPPELATEGHSSDSSKLSPQHSEPKDELDLKSHHQDSDLGDSSQHSGIVLDQQYLDLQRAEGDPHDEDTHQVVKMNANGQLVEMLQHVGPIEGDQHHMVVQILPPGHPDLKDATYYTPVTTAQQLQRSGSLLSEERYLHDQLASQHYTEDLLANDLTDDDKRLAAALMAVQSYSRQQQQQLNKLLEPGSIVCTSASEANVIMSVTDSMQSLIATNQLGKVVTTDAGQETMGDMVVEYIQHVEDEEHPADPSRKPMRLVAYHPESSELEGHETTTLQPMVPDHSPQLTAHQAKTITHAPPILKKALSSQMSPRARYKRSVEATATNMGQGLMQELPIDAGRQAAVAVITPKVEEEEELETEDDLDDSDYEGGSGARTSRRSLPHKKRISRKLKNPKKPQEKVFKCTKCEETFPTQASLNSHRPIHAKKILFNCEICGKYYPNQLKFFEHLKSHYEPPKLGQAAQLKETPAVLLEEAPAGDNHPSVIVQELAPALPPPLTCPHCQKVFRRQNTLEKHISTMHPPPPPEEEIEDEDMMADAVEMPDNSELLQEGIGDEETLKKEEWFTHHELTAVPIGDHDVLVDPNQKIEDQDGTVLTEISVSEMPAIEEEFPNHHCHYCGESFENKVQLIIHVKEEHPTVKRRGRGKKDLASDIAAAVVGEKNRKWEQLTCPTCGRMFNHRNSLVYHLRSHTGERPHQCEVCGKSFFAASALKVHMRLHSGDKPYKCELCGRHFRQWGDLKYHCISIHTDEKQYQCEYCGKDFARKYSLIVHRRIHTGEKNYKCEFCNKTFRASSYLQNHRRIHTGEKPHACEVCGKPFRVRSDMKRHMQTHTRDPTVGVTPSGSATSIVHAASSQSSQSSSQGDSHTHHGDLSQEMDPIAAEITIQDASEREEVAVASAALEQDQEPPTPGGGDHDTSLTAGEEVQEEVMQYSRDPLETVRDNAGNTLYVWPIYMA